MSLYTKPTLKESVVDLIKSILLAAFLTALIAVGTGFEATL